MSVAGKSRRRGLARPGLGEPLDTLGQKPYPNYQPTELRPPVTHRAGVVVSGFSRCFIPPSPSIPIQKPER